MSVSTESNTCPNCGERDSADHRCHWVHTIVDRTREVGRAKLGGHFGKLGVARPVVELYYVCSGCGVEFVAKEKS